MFGHLLMAAALVVGRPGGETAATAERIATDAGSGLCDLVFAPPLFGIVAGKTMQSFGDHVEYGTSGGQRHVLHEARHLQRRLRPDGAGIRRNFAADDLQQCRLPGSIAPDDRDALTGIDLQRHVVQQRQVAECNRNVIQRYKWHR